MDKSKIHSKANTVKGRRVARLLGIPIWIIALLLTIGITTSIAYVLLGPLSAPKSQKIGAVTVGITGIESAPLYGNLFDWDYW